ncbi:uncharacterized protein CCOS01_09843 [Colletotrichum costaricense]|uniref:DUF202 domain-containing protein n=1 Tax=Colletotrichum costaricense TaxID=1209916 RepID=A0AAI9YSN5_9PEZI|nr:uncharacterized protein CCOS01_09843 [Colletotrichum costaricense]KAK1522131.1 hypothetical protein CCOS01_09843 [Colletotrichum costaricense]
MENSSAYILSKNARVFLKATDVLSDHLSLIIGEGFKTLLVFHHRAFLERSLEVLKTDREDLSQSLPEAVSIGCLDPTLLQETLRTLDLLFPPSGDGQSRRILEKWVQKEDLDPGLLEPGHTMLEISAENKTPDDLQELYMQYPHWAPRLARLLKEVDDPTPTTRWERYAERRKSPRHMYKCALAAFIVAAIFGILATVLAAVQVWISYCAWVDDPMKSLVFNSHLIIRHNRAYCISAMASRPDMDDEDLTFHCCAPLRPSELLRPIDVGDLGGSGHAGKSTFLAWPIFGPLLFQNETSDARDHCANERTFLSYLRLSVYMSIVAVAIVLSFHLKSEPSQLELRMAKPLGIIFWVLAVACLCLGIGNYIKTVNKYSRKAAIVQTGWRTQLVLAVVALSIVGTCVVLLVITKISANSQEGQKNSSTNAEAAAAAFVAGPVLK